MIPKLPELIQRRMAERNLSIREAARRAKMPFTTLHDIESGKQTDIRVSTILGLSRALAEPPGVIFRSAIESVKNAESTD